MRKRNDQKLNRSAYRPAKQALVIFGLCILCVAMYSSTTTITPSALIPTGTMRVTHRILAEDNIYEAAAMMYTPPPKTSMLIGIFSTTGEKYSKRRDYIKDSFLGQDEPRLCSLKEFVRQTAGSRKGRVCQVAYTFVIGAGGNDRPTDHDDDEPLTLNLHGNFEDDCTYLNIKENMEDGKSPTYLKFAANFADRYDIDYVVKMDDDSVISHNALFDWIDSELPPTPYNRRIYGGFSRPSRVKNTVYAAGEFYFVSADLADYVGNELTAADRLNMMHPKRHIEDLDMGTFIFSNPRPVKFIGMYQWKMWTHPHKTETQYREGFTHATKTKRIKVKPVFRWDIFCPPILNDSCF
eukprot:scaffold387_cov266-Chaetoceros_neogracile.AAC.5